MSDPDGDPTDQGDEDLAGQRDDDLAHQGDEDLAGQRDDDLADQPRGVLPSKRAHDREAGDDVDPESVLDRLDALDVRTWHQVAGAGEVEHLGPAAEEFYETFGLGESPDSIAAGDADGVALAAIQGLSARVRSQRERIERQDARIDDQRATIAEQRDDLESLRSTVESVAVRLAEIEGRLDDDRGD